MSTCFPRPTVVTSGSSGSRAPVLAIWMWGSSMAAPSGRGSRRSAPACLPGSERIQPGDSGRLWGNPGTAAPPRTWVSGCLVVQAGCRPGGDLVEPRAKYTSERMVGRRGMAQQPSRGLADVVAAATALSDIDGTVGRLSYRGYDINQLAGAATFEEVAYLLQRGAPPGSDELAAYHAEIVAGRELGGLISTDLPQIAHNQEPMEALRTLVSLASAGDPDKDSNAPDAN